MKLALLQIILLCLTFSAFAQGNGSDRRLDDGNREVEKERSITTGIASPYSFELNTVGINARIYYNVGEEICFGPEFAYFRNSEAEVIDFDLVIHYIFEIPWAGIYPLIGVNYTLESELSHDDSSADVGLVIGAGIHRNIKGITAFLEYSRVELGIVDQFFTAGIMYNFN